MSHRFSLAAAAFLTACASPGSQPGEPTPLARAIRSLRAAAVGDRRFGDVKEGATPARHGPRDRTTRRLGPQRDGARGARDTASAVASRAESAPPAALDSNVPSVVIRFTSTTTPPRTIWMGDTIAFPEPAPPAGTPAPIARDLRWTSTDPDAATVSSTGVVTARRPGDATIIAWRRVGEMLTPVTVHPAVRGRVVAADGTPVQARIVVESADWTDTTLSGADGGFVLRSPRRLAGAATLRIQPTAASAAPALLADAPLGRLGDLDIVLLPARWRIAAGTYAGTSVAIDPAVAQGRAQGGRRYWRISQPGRAVGWSAAQLPLAVAFAPDAPVGAADSAAFWRAARQLERDWGAPLFRPAERSAGTAEDFRGIVVTVDAGLRSAGLTTASWGGDGNVSDATVTFRSRALLADPAVATHELMHALGLGHASDEWTSVMHPVAGAHSRATVDDIAYGQLLYAVRARARGTGTAVGLAEAAAAVRSRY